MSEAEPKSQAERLREAARALDADESPDALDRVMGKLDLRKKPVPGTRPDKD